MIAGKAAISAAVTPGACAADEAVAMTGPFQRRRRGLKLRAEMGQGIDGLPVEIELEVQVRAGRKAGVAGERDDVALLDLGAGMDRLGDLGEVRVGGLEPGVLDADMIAEPGDRPGDLDLPVRGGANERADRSAEIDAGVQSKDVKDRVKAEPEQRRDRSALDRREDASDACGAAVAQRRRRRLRLPPPPPDSLPAFGSKQRKAPSLPSNA